MKVCVLNLLLIKSAIFHTHFLSNLFLSKTDRSNQSITTMEANQQQQHLLIITYPVQSHINPTLHLANRIARTTAARVTFSTAVSAHRKMFPNLATPNQEVDDNLITYIPFSDGYDESFDVGLEDESTLSRSELVSSSTLSSIIDNLKSQGRPVTCLIYVFMVHWAVDVAIHHCIPFAQYWIQPATVFAIYYHYFHGYDAILDKHKEDPLSLIKLPGLNPVQLRDLPSILISRPTSFFSFVFNTIKQSFATVDRTTRSAEKIRPKVLVNTFDELETEALGAVVGLELIAVGPVLSSLIPEETNLDLVKADAKGYIEWLDSKPEKSVVYVSFGSITVVNKPQREEILKGLKLSGKPYLWVVRKGGENEEGGVELEEMNGDNGMVVEWCSQVRVLNHPSVGCFVTHCGWNSTIESLFCGVPTVGVPQWSDQATNAMLIEKEWGTGVKGEVNEDRLVLEGEELARCLDLVMGEGESGAEIRRKAEMWKEKAREAVREGGSSDRNLKAFVNEITDQI